MPNGIQQQIVRTTYPALNDINDLVPGGQQSFSGANVYAAQLGMRQWLDGNPGGVRYDTAIGTLYGGKFQYVQFYSGMTQAPARGLPCSWAYDQATVSTNVYAAFQQYIVTCDMSALRTGRFAGVVLNAVTKGLSPSYTGGYCGWIQCSGLASCLFAASGIAATPADGDLVYVNSAGNNFLEQNDTGTTVTFAILKAVVGTAVGAPVAGAISTVLLKGVSEVV
jgi:hypothetical protein